MLFVPTYGGGMEIFMDKQAREAREHMKALSLKDKWANFWYYYKKHVIIAIFTIVVVSVSVAQCSNRIDYDLNISYYSSNGAFSGGIEKLEEMMESVAADTNGNDVVDVGVAMVAADPTVMNEQTQAVSMKLMTEMAAGESMGYIFDENYKTIALHQYDELADTILDISVIPEIKETLGVIEGEKLYWFTKTLYDAEKNDEEKLAEHENAVKVEKLFIEMGAEIVEQAK